MADDLRSPIPPLSPRPFARWTWQLVTDVVNEYRRDGVGDLAAAITFWTILSVPAAVLALVSTLSSLESILGASVANDLEREVQQFITDTLVESETLSSAVGELFASSSAGVATIATIAALFTLSRAFAGLIRALDVAYEVEDGRPWWYLRLVAVGLGVATVVVVAAAATLLAVLPSLPFGGIGRAVTAPGVFLFLVAWAAAIFHVAPNHRTPWRYDVPGAVVTALGWIVASQAFALYVRFAGRGNRVQTSVGAVLLALSLVYLLSVVLLVGAEVNDVIARRAGVVQEPRSVEARAKRWRDRLVSWLRDDGPDEDSDDATTGDPDAGPQERT